MEHPGGWAAGLPLSVSSLGGIVDSGSPLVLLHRPDPPSIVYEPHAGIVSPLAPSHHRAYPTTSARPKRYMHLTCFLSPHSQGMSIDERSAKKSMHLTLAFLSPSCPMKGLSIDERSAEKMRITGEELVEEKGLAMECLNEAA